MLREIRVLGGGLLHRMLRKIGGAPGSALEGALPVDEELLSFDIKVMA